MLRPFAGIREYTLHEIIECLYLLQGELASDRLNKAIPHAILKIIATLQGAVQHPLSPFLRDRLIDTAGVEKLTAWLDIITSASLRYMRGLSHDVALSGYLEYLLREPPGLPYAEAAVHAAVADSFDRKPNFEGETDYITSAVLLCVRYPAIGDSFHERINCLTEKAADPDLIEALRHYRQAREG
ncbi:MAG: hypothetical protein U0840_24945 [Gemmataceae bacterium]